MEEEKVHRQKSEFQDVNRVFQRIDEALISAEDAWIKTNSPGGYPYLDMFLSIVDAAYRQFQFICTKEEQKNMEERREAVIKIGRIEINRINNQIIYNPENYPIITDKFRKAGREYLQEVYRLREAHKLGSRVTRPENTREKIDNAARF